jgi:hypothetical protein
MSSALNDNSCALKEGIPTAKAIIKAITPFKLACLVMIRIISGCKRGNNRWGSYNPPGSCQGVFLKICFLIYFYYFIISGELPVLVWNHAA